MAFLYIIKVVESVDGVDSKMKVSVCLATYNGELYIQDQINSILPQLNDQDEVVVSDNGSTDKTLDILSSYGNRIIVLHEQRKGVVANFENALSKVSGDLIFLADQDDVWLPSKIDKVVAALEDCDLVLTDAKVVDYSLNELKSSLFNTNNSKPGIIRNLIKNSYVGCCMAFRRKLLVEALPFPENIPMHDWWIGLVAEARFKVKFINESLILYRRHEGNVSVTSNKSSFNLWVKLKWRFVMLYKLLFRLLGDK